MSTVEKIGAFLCLMAAACAFGVYFWTRTKPEPELTPEQQAIADRLRQAGMDLVPPMTQEEREADWRRFLTRAAEREEQR